MIIFKIYDLHPFSTLLLFTILRGAGVTRGNYTMFLTAEADLDRPERVRATNMRLFMATMSQAYVEMCFNMCSLVCLVWHKLQEFSN